MEKEKIHEILAIHKKWLMNETGGSCADLRGANLSGASLCGANLRDADLRGANLSCASLCDADLFGANLCGARLRDANLCRAALCGASLRDADLRGANLSGASLCDADLFGANLCGAENMVKIVGVEIGNTYWKRCDADVSSNGYKYKLGINKLRNGEVFADDERVLCSYPGIHFASRSWGAANYSDRPVELKIRIPKGAKINEPWATDGKASADKIEVLEIWRDGKLESKLE